MSILRVRVIPRTPNPVPRRCPRCDLIRPFESSGKFRVNAQKRRLDVWLVFKCPSCDATWNASVVERAAPERVEHLDRFHANDPELAFAWATAIGGGAADFELASGDGWVRLGGPRRVEVLELEMPWPFRVRLDRVLARALSISRAQAARLAPERWARHGLRVVLSRARGERVAS